jgi:hypothetical protein
MTYWVADIYLGEFMGCSTFSYRDMPTGSPRPVRSTVCLSGQTILDELFIRMDQPNKRVNSLPETALNQIVNRRKSSGSTGC